MMLGLGDLHKGMKDRAQVLNITDAVEKQGTLKGYLGSDIDDNGGPSSKKNSADMRNKEWQIQNQIKIELTTHNHSRNDESSVVGDR